MSGAICREGEEVDQRIGFLEKTMTAHIKLSEEIHPDELAAHSSSADPVAAALAARRQQLQTVKDSYDKLVNDCVPPCQDQGLATGYYAVLETALKRSDHDAVEFQKVLEGK